MSQIDFEYDPYSYEIDLDPYPLYRRLRDDAPVHWDAPNETYVLTRHDDVYAVLMDHKRYSSIPLDILEGRQPPTSEIRQQDEPRHRFIRNTVGALFNPPAMRRREEVIRAIVRELVDRSEEHEEGAMNIRALAGEVIGTFTLVFFGSLGVATLAGRSERTARLADGAAALELLPDLAAVVRKADIVLSIVPPEAAESVAADIAEEAKREGVRPLMADLNAVAPATAGAQR